MRYRTLLRLSDVNCTCFMERVIYQSSCTNDSGHTANLILLVTGSVHRVFIIITIKIVTVEITSPIIIKITIML